MSTTTQTIDQAKLDEFMGRFVGDLLSAGIHDGTRAQVISSAITPSRAASLRPELEASDAVGDEG
jgi:hypothetical protein